MTWFKVDDGLAFHPKVLDAGNMAMGLWVRAGAWCMANLTDGRLPRAMIAPLDGRKRDADRLIRAGLWEQVDGGYQFVDWHQWQPTKVQVKADREATRERVSRWREGRRNGVSNGVTNTVTNGVSNTAPTRPDPSLGSGTGSQSTNGHSAPRQSDRLDLQRLATILHSDQGWAERVATQVLDRAPADVRNPTAYVEHAIREHIEDYRPTPTPPKIGDLCWHGRPATTCPDCQAAAASWA